jgi:hypothetical protein
VSENSGIGPYDRLPTDGGQTVPLYLITFDKRGRCQSPLTLARVLDEVKNGAYTDVHIFSHGWNNVFKDAVSLYRNFFARYFQLRSKHVLNGTGYSPVLVGIIWPSTLLVLPWEATPRIAGTGSGPERDDLEGADAQALLEVAEALAPSERERLYYFAERGPTLTPTEARELAILLLPIYQASASQTSEIGQAASSTTVDDLITIWQKTFPRRNVPSGKAGFARETSVASAAHQPSVAGGPVEWLDPRLPVRIASVLQMKDRAGIVGAAGVGPELVQKLLATEKVRTHLIGHSYGSKVMLSALCYQTPAAPAASLLLLEPAISYLCFAENIDGSGRGGGYRQAVDHVKQPILSTFSRSDAPLTKFFHLAVVRDSDWGEQKIAGVPPSKFAALGGFGPGGLREGESKTLDVLSPETGPAANKYPRGEAGIKIYGLDGSNGQINGHGDVATDFTAWAHLSLVAGGNLR